MVRVVNGFAVKSFTVKKESVKVVLDAEKDDVRAGEGGIADVLESLELHATASDSSTVSAALRTSVANMETRPFEFTVTSFTVKSNNIKLVLEANKEDGDEASAVVDVVTALAVHSASEDSPVELRLESTD